MSAGVIGYRFGYSRLCRPSLQVCGKVRVIGQALENKTACICALPLSQPPAGLHAQRDMNGLLALVHHYRQHPTVPVFRDVAPLQLSHIAQTQAAVAGEKISMFDVLPFAGSRYKGFHLVDSQVFPFPFGRLCPFVT